MANTVENRTPWILWPFAVVWRLLTLLLEVTGRILCAVLGLLLIAIGVASTLTIVGAPVGVPFAVFGVLLTIRALF